MKKNYLSFLFAITFLTTGIWQTNLNAQCSLTSYFGIAAPTSGTAFTILSSFGPGQYVSIPVLNGGSYAISTCGASIDTQITVWNNAVSSVLAFNDDNGPLCLGSSASIDNFVPNFTNYMYAQISQFNCLLGGSASINLSIRQNNNLAFTSASTAMCSGQSRTLTATPANVGSTPGSYGNPGSFSGTGVTGNVFTAPTVSVPTNYTITYTFGYVSQDQIITVNPVPTLSTNITNTTVCSGTTLTLNASGASTYTWTGGISNNVSFPANSSTSYSVTGTSTAGCVSGNTAVVNVTVNPNPTITVNSGSICSGQSFTMVPSGALTYTFTNGSPVVTPATNVTVNVTGTSAQGCVSSNTAVSSITVYTRPTISANNPTICSGQQATITVTGGVSGCTINALPTSSNYVSTYTTSTTFTIIGISPQGCLSANTLTNSVTVNSLPVVTVNSGSICAGKSFTIVPSGASTYTYSSGSPVIAPSTNTTVNVTGTSSLGCVSSNTAVSSITVAANPTVSVVGTSTSICVGQSSATLTAFGANSYSWSNGASTQSIVVSPSAATNYSVTGTGTNGCSSSGTIAIGISPLPSITAIASPSFICVGATSTITALGAGTYSWNNGANSASIVVSPSLSSIFTVTGTTSQGCSNVVLVAVFTNSNQITTTPASTVCSGTNLTLSANGAVTYTWNGTQFSQSITITPTSSAVYSVSATDSNNCLLSKTVSVGVYQLPNVSSVINYSIICLGESATVTANGASTYSWSTGVSGNSIVVTPPAPSNYTYQVTGTDANNCKASSVSSLTVSGCLGTGAINQTPLSLKVYPNPNNGEFNISAGENLTIVVVNELGQHLKTIELNSTNNHHVAITDLPNGIYFIIGSGSQHLVKQKVVVSR